MRIGIDARFLGPNGGGIGRYLKNLIPALVSSDPANEYIIFCRSEVISDLKHALALSRNVNHVRLVPVNIRWYSVAEQLILPWIFYRYRLSLLHVPHMNIPWLYFGKFVLTIHDMTKWEYGKDAARKGGGLKFFLQNFFYRMTFSLAVSRAMRIIVPSQFSADKLVHYLPKVKTKVKVIPEACDPVFMHPERPDDVLRKENTPPYILYVGALYPYKNVFRVIEALARLSSPVCLAIATFHVDMAKVLVRRVKAAGDSVCVRLHLNPTDEELRALYAGARALIQPSLSEGFGLPCLEAMGMGIPVLAARAGSLPEVCGDAAVYFDPNSIEDIRRAILAVISDSTQSKDLIEKGYKQLNRFSWRASADETLRVYEAV